MKLYAVVMKTCARCKEDKPVTEYGKRKAAADGLHPYCRGCVRASNKASYSRHADERRTYASRYRADNLEAVLARQAEYRARPSNRERANERSRQWRKDNPERMRAGVVDWLRRNPGKAAEYSETYRSRKLNAFVEPVEFTVLLERHGMWCYLCESPIGLDESVDMDHVQPLSRGGLHCYDNIRPTHSSCNRSKNDALLHELDLPFVPPHLKVGIN